MDTCNTGESSTKASECPVFEVKKMDQKKAMCLETLLDPKKKQHICHGCPGIEKLFTEDGNGNVLMVKTHHHGWIYPGGQIENIGKPEADKGKKTTQNERQEHHSF